MSYKVVKFYEGTTTQTQERVHSIDMEFPQLMIRETFINAVPDL